MTLPMPDWQQWFAWKIPEAAFELRRERYLQFAMYRQRFDAQLDGIEMVTTDLPKYQDRARKGGLWVSTQQRLWSAMDWMSLQYSAGAAVAQLAEVWPHALEWAEEYGRFHEAYHRSPEAKGRVTPHVALVSEEYWFAALRPVCLGLLTGNAHEMPRVMAFLDYANAELGIYDGLLERLVAPYTSGRPAPPDKATRHLPYRKLFKVFDAAPEQRPALMAKYLGEWYHASRREPYEGQHEGSGFGFYGYWSWEAAAATFVLNIDDSSYRDMAFYPKDLVDYARQHAAGAAAQAARTPERVPAGKPVPMTGWWYTPARADSRRYFRQGDVFPKIERTDYGETFWLWSSDQSAPTLD